jgi:hypothetical protein
VAAWRVEDGSSDEVKINVRVEKEERERDEKTSQSRCGPDSELGATNLFSNSRLCPTAYVHHAISRSGQVMSNHSSLSALWENRSKWGMTAMDIYIAIINPRRERERNRI